MKDHINPVTESDVVKFAGFIATWQTALNLGDWRLIYSDKPAKGAMAEVDISVSDHTAVYRLGKHFGSEKVTDLSLEQTALHELIHVLLAEYCEMAKAKATDELLMAAEHRIVHTLERLLVK